MLNMSIIYPKTKITKNTQKCIVIFELMRKINKQVSNFANPTSKLLCSAQN
jgi:hypothetical protein